MILWAHGKRVAIVGRAGSIIGTGHGAAIDAADIVIRINWVLPLEDERAADIGTRTDLVYHCRRAQMARRTARRLGVPTVRVRGRRRHAAAKKHFKRPDDFRPTTGFMCAVECLDAGAASVSIYGFDVFRSGHIQAREPEGDNYSRPLGWAHNPEEERLAWKRLIRKDRRLIPDAILKRAIR